MKKVLNFIAILSIGFIFASAPVLADGLVFDPDNYPVSTADASIYSKANTTYSASTVNTKDVTDIKSQNTRENNNMQDALFKLDSAQTDIRNQLIDAKAKYTDIDNQYHQIKEMRKLQRKTVRDAEKKIKKIEKNKNQIRSLMQIDY